MHGKDDWSFFSFQLVPTPLFLPLRFVAWSGRPTRTRTWTRTTWTRWSAAGSGGRSGSKVKKGRSSSVQFLNMRMYYRMY